MACLPLISKAHDLSASGSPCRPEITLPTFYMADHSVMGLRVEPYDLALDLLGSHAVLRPQAGGWAQLEVDDAAHLNTLLVMLQSHGLAWEMTDLVDQVYQG